MIPAGVIVIAFFRWVCYNKYNPIAMKIPER